MYLNLLSMKEQNKSIFFREAISAVKKYVAENYFQYFYITMPFYTIRINLKYLFSSYVFKVFY